MNCFSPSPLLPGKTLTSNKSLCLDRALQGVHVHREIITAGLLGVNFPSVVQDSRSTLARPRVPVPTHKEINRLHYLLQGLP